MFSTDQGSCAAAPDQRVEQKFFVLPRDMGFAYALLRQSCRADPEYPQGLVCSLYLDDVNLEQYYRSTNGDFAKDKVRIRWYDDPSDAREPVAVFVELKSRRGLTCNKQRKQVVVPPTRLAPGNLGKAIVDKLVLQGILAEFGYYPHLPLRPVITVSYWRRRFREMLSGVRVAFDSDLCSSTIAPELARGAGHLRLPGAVIEVKGTTLELPGPLARLRLLYTDWSRFSKYAQCVESHLSNRGSVGWLWPSGRWSGA